MKNVTYVGYLVFFAAFVAAPVFSFAQISERSEREVLISEFARVNTQSQDRPESLGGSEEVHKAHSSEDGDISTLSIEVFADDLSGSLAGDGWSLSWDYQINGYSVTGETVFTNSTGESIPVELNIDMPAVSTYGSAQLNGSVHAKLVNGSGGGVMSSVSGNPVWELKSGNTPIHNVFADPFMLGGSGAGESNLSTNPINISDVVLEDTSMEIKFSLDPSTESTAILTTNLFVTENPSADLNGDGIVDATDLLIMLGNWGDCESMACPADLNRDGSVGSDDLNLLLNLWDTDGVI